MRRLWAVQALDLPSFDPEETASKTALQAALLESRFEPGRYDVSAVSCRVHRLFDEMTLAKSLNTAATLLNDPRLQKHFAWVAKLRIKAEGRR